MSISSILGLALGILFGALAFSFGVYLSPTETAQKPPTIVADTQSIRGIPIEGDLKYQANKKILDAADMLERRTLDVPICMNPSKDDAEPPEGYIAAGGESLQGILNRFIDTTSYAYTILWIVAFRGPDAVCSVYEYSYTRTDLEVPVPANAQ